MDEIFALDLCKPYIGERYSFDRLPEAVVRLKSGSTTGKVVVKIE